MHDGRKVWHTAALSAAHILHCSPNWTRIWPINVFHLHSRTRVAQMRPQKLFGSSVAGQMCHRAYFINGISILWNFGQPFGYSNPVAWPTPCHIANGQRMIPSLDALRGGTRVRDLYRTPKTHLMVLKLRQLFCFFLDLFLLVL